MKIGNFGRLDPTLKAKDITGLEHGSFAEEPIWKEFWGNLDKLAFESERLFAEKAGKKVEDTLGADIQKLPQGREREVMVRCGAFGRHRHLEGEQFKSQTAAWASRLGT